MAEKTSLSLSMTAANGDKLTKAVTDVNPAAENSALNAFAQGLAELTTNTLNTTSKITKQEIGGSYTPINFTVRPESSSFTPTKVDDHHYTIAHADLAGEDVDKYYGLNSSTPSIYWASVGFIADLKVPITASMSVTNDSGTYVIWAYLDVNPFQTTAFAQIELGILNDASEDTQSAVGYSFDITVNAGSYQEYTWDAYTINIKIV